MFKLLKNLKLIDYLFILIIIGLIVLQVFLDLRLPDYTINIMRELQKIAVGAKPVMKTILVNGGFMLACAFGSLASAIIVGFFVANVATRLSYNLRAKVYNKIENFSLTEINKFSTASLITRTTNDVTQIQMFLALGMQALIKAPILAACAVVKILNKSWQWSVATGAAIAIMFVMILIIVSLTLPKFKKIQTLTDNINRVTRENLTGIRVVRASNAEDFEIKKFEECNDAITKNNLFATRIMSIMNPGMSLIMSGLNLAIYWIGAYIVPGMTDGLGNLMTFTTYAMQVVMAFMMLIMIFILMPRALVSAKRINEVLDTKNSIESGTFVGERNVKTSVVFDNVSFKYPDADEYVLKNISFEAKEGETVAFIGSTGSGKSTLINLIPRLYDATEGRVLIDGVDVKKYDLEMLNKKIGYVPQRGVLFSGTVESNVNFGDNDADEKTISNAISVAQATNFVNRMGGSKSAISQGGVNVSGGQKQRLSIARAIARKPEIFIFDDSFSALDYKTDRKLRTALKKHTSNVTKFIVAQRIGTIKDADKIIVLDDGNMVGMGTHDELIKNCAVYQEIALSQLSKEEL